jgi:sugar transferase (PEP-CTERM/EpsH1 system associated)
VKPIRVMHVVRTLATGGTENVVRKLMSALDPHRFQQTVCTLIAGDESRLVNTISLDRRGDRAEFLVPKLARLFVRMRPDVVHSRNWATIEAVAAAKLARINAVVHSEHGRDLQTMGRQPWRRRHLRRLSYAWADRVFCVSQELKDYYCRELGIEATSLEVIPNGVDVEQYRPNLLARMNLRGKLGVDLNTMVVGTVSRLDPIKDHFTLLNAVENTLRKGVKLKLVIVGDGSNRTWLENELASRPDLSLHTVLTGDVRDVSDWLNSFDVFVLPSLSEGMSNTLLEAMAVGVAPIATAVGGNTEVIVDGHSGLLVQPKDAGRICDYLTTLSAAHDWRRDLGRNARERVMARFSVESMLQGYERMYCQLVSTRDINQPVLSRA